MAKRGRSRSDITLSIPSKPQTSAARTHGNRVVSVLTTGSSDRTNGASRAFYSITVSAWLFTSYLMMSF